MAIFCVRLQVELGWSIPDFGDFVAEWESPTACVVVVKADKAPDFSKVKGVEAVEQVSLAFAKGLIAPPVGGRFSWAS